MKEFINDILSSPFGLVLETVIGIALLILIFLSRTSFGKKMILNLTAKIVTNEKQVESKVKELKDTKESLEKSFEEQKKIAELKEKEAEKKFQLLESFLLNALKSINNVKVQTAVENYEKLKAEQLTDDYEKVGCNGEKE